MESTEPLHRTLKGLLELRGISIRELGRRTGIHFGSLSRVTRGEFRLSMETMEAVATALDVPPETFAEYRLAKLRRELDPGAVGLPAALRKAAEIQR